MTDALATVPPNATPEEAELAPWDPSKKPALWSTIKDPGTVLAALNDATPLRAIINKEIEIEHVMAHMVELADRETGEVSERPRTILLATDGKAYAAVSAGVMGSLKLIASLMGPPPWNGGLTCEVKEVQTNNKFRVLKLVPKTEDTAPKKRGK
jgi:hypothetical protein